MWESERKHFYPEKFIGQKGFWKESWENIVVNRFLFKSNDREGREVHKETHLLGSDSL